MDIRINFNGDIKEFYNVDKIKQVIIKGVKYTNLTFTTNNEVYKFHTKSIISITQIRDINN